MVLLQKWPPEKPDQLEVRDHYKLSVTKSENSIFETFSTNSSVNAKRHKQLLVNLVYCDHNDRFTRFQRISISEWFAITHCLTQVKFDQQSLGKKVRLFKRPLYSPDCSNICDIFLTIRSHYKKWFEHHKRSKAFYVGRIVTIYTKIKNKNWSGLDEDPQKIIDCDEYFLRRSYFFVNVKG